MSYICSSYSGDNVVEKGAHMKTFINACAYAGIIYGAFVFGSMIGYSNGWDRGWKDSEWYWAKRNSRK